MPTVSKQLATDGITPVVTVTTALTISDATKRLAWLRQQQAGYRSAADKLQGEIDALAAAVEAPPQ
jgi:hypothetical protein